MTCECESMGCECGVRVYVGEPGTGHWVCETVSEQIARVTAHDPCIMLGCEHEYGHEGLHSKASETIDIVGWDGRSNPIYGFRSDLGKPAHERRSPTVREVLAQYPDAMWITATFERVRLRDWATDVAGY